MPQFKGENTVINNFKFEENKPGRKTIIYFQNIKGYTENKGEISKRKEIYSIRKLNYILI